MVNVNSRIAKERVILVLLLGGQFPMGAGFCYDNALLNLIADYLN